MHLSEDDVKSIVLVSWHWPHPPKNEFQNGWAAPNEHLGAEMILLPDIHLAPRMFALAYTLYDKKAYTGGE